MPYDYKKLRFNSNYDHLIENDLSELNPRIANNIYAIRTRLRKNGGVLEDAYAVYLKWKEQNPELYKRDFIFRQGETKEIETIGGAPIEVIPEALPNSDNINEESSEENAEEMQANAEENALQESPKKTPIEFIMQEKYRKILIIGSGVVIAGASLWIFRNKNMCSLWNKIQPYILPKHRRFLEPVILPLHSTEERKPQNYKKENNRIVGIKH